MSEQQATTDLHAALIAEQQAVADLRAALAAQQATQIQIAALQAALKQRAGLLGEVGLSGDAPYASTADLIALDDLHEVDVIVRRWRAGRKPLKLRVRALDLDQQERIDIESTVQHEKTGEWVRSGALYAAATLREAVIVPKLDGGKEHLLRKHNPVIINELVQFIWTLSRLDDDLIERLVHIDDPPTPATTDLVTPGE